MSEAQTWSLLLQLEQEARQAATIDAFQFIAANETRRLLTYRQAVIARRTAGGRFVVSAVSNLAVVDRTAPFIQWMEALLRKLAKQHDPASVFAVKAADLSEDDRADWVDWHPAVGHWQPLKAPDGSLIGVLWVGRDAEMNEAEAVLLNHLAGAYAHAWQALANARRRKLAGASRWKRVVGWGVAVAVIGAMALPVPLSVIAPATVSPKDAYIIAAPISGVIEEVPVSSNGPVLAGDVLVRFRSDQLAAAAEVAERARLAAEAALRRARQQAFGDPQSKAEVALRDAELRLKAAEADYAAQQLAKVELVSPQSGLAVFNDRNELRGRPVQLGERIMLLADETAVELSIQVPVGDAIALEPGAPIKLFLDIDPLTAIDARLEKASFEAQTGADGVLAYSATAAFSRSEEVPRIGLKGSAKIIGDDVPLVLYLLRKPLAALRQWVGY